MTSTTGSTPRRRGATSRLGGKAVAIDPAAAPVIERQLALGFDTPPVSRVGREVLPGVVHIRDWLDVDAQRALVQQFLVWARPPAGLRHPRMPTGHLMSVQSVCLGWHWRPYAYSKHADDTDHAPVKALPETVRSLARLAVADAYGATATDACRYAPDAAIVNRYPEGARLGLHQDHEEPSDAPVVTISLGDTCVFRMAGVDRRTGPYTDVELTSGDLLVFGRANRRIHHGVPKVDIGSSTHELGLPAGRLSITIRETGFTDPRPRTQPVTADCGEPSC
jgi:DNA oxidative demethylase